MAITITSRFTPLTYDEITRPLVEQTAVQEEMENAYVEASTQAADMMAQANQQTDPIAYSRLKQYAENLQAQADNLMRRGLSSNSRQALLNMHKQYSKDIVPVSNAIKRRNELSEEIRKLKLTHPDLLVERDVLGIDDLLRNPQMDYGRTALGSEITNAVGNAVAAAARGIQSIRLGKNLDKYTQTVIQESGFTVEQIQAAIANGASDQSILSSIRDSILQRTGVADWNNQAAMDRAMQYANEGLWRGVGETKIGTQQDYEAVENLKFQHSLALMREKARLDEQAAARARAAAATDPMNGLFGGWRPNPEDILFANGKQGKINEIVAQLVGENGAMNPAYVGNNGANPLAVYERYKELKEGMEQRQNQRLHEAEQEMIKGFRDAHQAVNPAALEALRRGYREEMQRSFDQAWAAIRDAEFPGVTQILTADQYNTLKDDLGYTNKSTGMHLPGDLNTAANNATVQYTLSSVNMPNMDTHDVTDRFQANLGSTSSDNQKAFIKEFNKTTGKAGNGVTLSSDTKLRDIQYSQLYPDKLIVTTTDGKKYLINPQLISSTAAQIVAQGNALMSATESIAEKNLIQEKVASAIYYQIDSYNPTAGTSSTKIE